MKVTPKWLTAAAVAAIGFFLLLLLFQPAEPVGGPEIPYSAFKQLASDGELQTVSLRGEEVSATLKRPFRMGRSGDTTAVRTRLPAMGDPQLLPLLETHGVELEILPERDESGRWLYGLLPWLILIGVYVWF